MPTYRELDTSLSLEVWDPKLSDPKSEDAKTTRTVTEQPLATPFAQRPNVHTREKPETLKEGYFKDEEYDHLHFLDTPDVIPFYMVRAGKSYFNQQEYRPKTIEQQLQEILARQEEARQFKTENDGGREAAAPPPSSPLSDVPSESGPAIPPVQGPRALRITARFTRKSFSPLLHYTRPRNRDCSELPDLCVSVFLNGEFQHSRVVAERFRPKTDNLYAAKTVSGRCVGNRMELPFVLLPPDPQDDGSSGDTETNAEWWDRIGKGLLAEADQWKPSSAESGASIMAKYLEHISHLKLPFELEEARRSGTRKFGVIDVVITSGISNLPNKDVGTLVLRHPRRPLATGELGKDRTICSVDPDFKLKQQPVKKAQATDINTPTPMDPLSDLINLPRTTRNARRILEEGHGNHPDENVSPSKRAATSDVNTPLPKEPLSEVSNILRTTGNARRATDQEHGKHPDENASPFERAATPPENPPVSRFVLSSPRISKERPDSVQPEPQSWTPINKPQNRAVQSEDANRPLPKTPLNNTSRRRLRGDTLETEEADSVPPTVLKLRLRAATKPLGKTIFESPGKTMKMESPGKTIGMEGGGKTVKLIQDLENLSKKRKAAGAGKSLIIKLPVSLDLIDGLASKVPESDMGPPRPKRRKPSKPEVPPKEATKPEVPSKQATRQKRSGTSSQTPSAVDENDPPLKKRNIANRRPAGISKDSIALPTPEASRIGASHTRASSLTEKAAPLTPFNKLALTATPKATQKPPGPGKEDIQPGRTKPPSQRTATNSATTSKEAANNTPKVEKQGNSTTKAATQQKSPDAPSRAASNPEVQASPAAGPPRASAADADQLPTVLSEYSVLSFGTEVYNERNYAVKEGKLCRVGVMVLQEREALFETTGVLMGVRFVVEG